MAAQQREVGRVPRRFMFAMEQFADPLVYNLVMGPVPANEVWVFKALVHHSGWTTPANGELQLVVTYPVETAAELGGAPLPFAQGGSGGEALLEAPATAPAVYRNELTMGDLLHPADLSEGGSATAGAEVHAIVLSGETDHRVALTVEVISIEDIP